MLSTRAATALYVGAVLGPGVLIVPALAARGRRTRVGARLGGAARAVGAAGGHVRRARRPLPGGRRDGGVRARGVRPRASAPITGWWFLAGVVLGAPAVALVGGFYVSELLGVGREAAVLAAAGMMATVTVANVVGLRASARLRTRPCGGARRAPARRRRDRAAGEPGRELDAVRAARLGGGRHRREPADALVHRLGGGLAPGRRAARPGAPAAARDLRRARASSSCSTSASRSPRSASSAPPSRPTCRSPT